MELDDLKLAWHALDKQLQQGNALNLQLFRDRTLDKARSHLRPLFWGQLAQMLFGLIFVLLAVAFWTLPLSREPPLLLGAGLTLHAYGVAVIIVSGITLGYIRRIDYSAPVVEIQRQLAQLRRTYVISGMVAGLPWWVIWMMPLIVLAGLAGDAEGVSWLTRWLGVGMSFGVAGLLGTGWFHRWSRHPSRPELARKMDDGLTGGSLRKVQARLDEIARFERE